MSWMDVNECLVLLQPLQSEDVARILLLLETFVADNEDSTRRSNIHAHQVSCSLHASSQSASILSYQQEVAMSI